MAKRKQKCRVCGCTTYDCAECIELTGGPCSWAEADLCSACVPRPINLVERGYLVVYESDTKAGRFCSAMYEGIQLLDSKKDAEEMRDAARRQGHPFARVVEVEYTVRSDGLPARPCNKGTHTKRGK